MYLRIGLVSLFSCFCQYASRMEDERVMAARAQSDPDVW